MGLKRRSNGGLRRIILMHGFPFQEVEKVSTWKCDRLGWLRVFGGDYHVGNWGSNCNNSE
jgi:hypothetical protein